MNEIQEYTVLVRNGLRFIQPYPFHYRVHAKERWLGRTVLDVYCREFMDQPPTYYAQALADGRITVNGERRTRADRVLRNGDLVRHLVHRHEPPVRADPPLRVIYRSETLLVVDVPYQDLLL